MLMADLAVDAARLHKAYLQAALVLAKTDKHCSGIIAARSAGATVFVPLRSKSAFIHRPRPACLGDAEFG